MSELREQWLILISTPIYAFIIGTDLLLSNLQHRKTYSVKDTFTNLYLMLLNGAIDLLFRVIYLAILNYFYLRSFITLTEGIAYWLLLLTLEDFLYYWLHRFDHEIRFFWAVHVTHNSSEKMNFSVGFHHEARRNFG